MLNKRLIQVLPTILWFAREAEEVGGDQLLCALASWVLGEGESTRRVLVILSSAPFSFGPSLSLAVCGL